MARISNKVTDVIKTIAVLFIRIVFLSSLISLSAIDLIVLVTVSDDDDNDDDVDNGLVLLFGENPRTVAYSAQPLCWSG